MVLGGDDVMTEKRGNWTKTPDAEMHAEERRREESEEAGGGRRERERGEEEIDIIRK
jgi:hypothetical protein